MPGSAGSGSGGSSGYSATDVEREIQQIREELRYISREESKNARNLKYFITTSLTLGFGVFAAVGYFNFAVNSSQISDKLSFEIAKVDEKLKDFAEKSEPLSATMSSTYQSGKQVLGVPYLSRDTLDSGLYAYTLKIEFQAEVHVFGDDYGALVGIKRRYDGDYARLMSSSSNVVYSDQLANGLYTYFPTAIVIPTYPQIITWSEQITKSNCKDVLAVLDMLKSYRSVGSVYIRPIFTKIKEKPDESRFDIKISDLASVYSCPDFK